VLCDAIQDVGVDHDGPQRATGGPIPTVPLAAVAALHGAPRRALSWHPVVAPAVAACPAPQGVDDSEVLGRDSREVLVDDVMAGRCLMGIAGKGGLWSSHGGLLAVACSIRN